MSTSQPFPQRPSDTLDGRRVRVRAKAARSRNLTVVPIGVVTQVLDLGITTLVRVRGESFDWVGDFSPDELELLNG